jgi:hypothetical protein
MEAAGSYVIEDSGFAGYSEGRAFDYDNGGEGGARLGPAAIAMAEPGYDRRLGNLIADGPAHTAALKSRGYCRQILGHFILLPGGRQLTSVSRQPDAAVLAMTINRREVKKTSKSVISAARVFGSHRARA